MVTLYLDSATRVFRCSTRAGMPALDPSLTADTVSMDASDEEWLGTYQPGIDTAFQRGMDMVVSEDGSVSYATHVPQADELRRQLLQAFTQNPNPSQSDVILALRRLIEEVLS